MLAAQLIAAGKRPYLDFFFPQTPLNAYWNGLWYAISGSAWRAAHAAAAVETSIAIWLTADFLLSGFPAVRWRLGAALVAACAIGTNAMVVEFGTLGQAYGLGLLFAVAAFRLSILVVERRATAWAALEGLLACAAASATLLTAPVVPILLVWTLVYDRQGSRVKKLVAFAAGGVVPFLPLLWLYAQSPAVVWFDVFRYHMFYRQVHWAGATAHDLDLMSSWIDSGQVLVLTLLAIAGLLFVLYRSEWERSRRAPFYLCAWIAAAEAAYLATPHPSFSQYFLFLTPFLGILAGAGLYAVASRLDPAGRPWRATALVLFLFGMGLARGMFDSRDDFSWNDAAQVVAKIREALPRHGSLYADEPFYVLMHYTPAPGMEHSDAHKLNMDPAAARPLHIIPGKELDRRVKAREFDTVVICDDDDRIEQLGLEHLYNQKADILDCTIFWERSGKQ